MENEFFNLNIDRDLDVASFISKGQVALNLASRNDDRFTAFMTPAQAREVAETLLKFADAVEGK
jgi:hypothetical protein